VKRDAKSKVISELEDKFNSANAVWVTEYRGLNVNDIKDLRVKLGDEVSYLVTKNTLAKIAAKNAKVSEDILEVLQGPTAFAFVNSDPIEAAKELKTFSKTNEALVIKGGIFEGEFVSSDVVLSLADLESREVLLSKVAGNLKGVLSKAASMFVAVPTKFAGTVQALADKQ